MEGGAENVHLLSMLYSNMAFTKTNKPKQLKSILLTVTLQGDKAYQLLAHGRWFSPGTLAYSTTKASRHNISEILLKVAFSTKESNQIKIMEMNTA
jgi:hypothetical protein